MNMRQRNSVSERMFRIKLDRWRLKGADGLLEEDEMNKKMA